MYEEHKKKQGLARGGEAKFSIVGLGGEEGFMWRLILEDVVTRERVLATE